MPVSRSGDSSGFSYADHDVHHVYHELQFLDTADAGPTTSYTDVVDFDITERGLDPDELAELRVLVVDATLTQEGTVTAQDEQGTVDAWLGAGYNLGEDEFLDSNRSIETIDSDSSGTDDFASVTNDTDEVGQIFAGGLSSGVSFSDTSDGTSGAAGYPHLRQVIDFGTMFGSGPYVDAADDFSSAIDLSVSNLVVDAAAEVRYSLYYRVDEVEGGRTRFGR